MSAQLVSLGLDSATADYFSALPGAAGLVPGRVIRVDKGLSTVLTENGPVRASWSGGLLAAIAEDTQATPCTGDWVALRHWPDDRTTLDAIAPRSTAIVRAEVGGTSKGQVLAANVDVIAIVVGLIPEPNIGRIERFLALAWESGARPVVVLTKADLVGDASSIAEDVATAAPGADVFVCSASTGEGLEAVRDLLAGNATMALLGSSGAGKSSLVNALAGVELLDVQAIREDGKGRHTSVRRELILLPHGGVVIDTPGLRGIGLQDSGEGLAAAFPDISGLAEQCKFKDCVHATEPGCAVQAALEDGTLPVRRYESWQKLQREAAFMARRTDARLRAEANKQWARQAKGYRRDIKPRR
ncbi:ribosome small subunit-dependent GTPase A [Kribbella flavida DSM 17836]|uniref:Small ribosomal subunit biogenesis GTPase RsgA n=1 Tax=Kribbella flavida (strain DSM 17836 / JCM 10339 / NBRC 14399) TaxID=479435 RepID=D2PKS7_KRIFD|nr:ribosome small subunit-dependent GTPase A [Kribbella flavida]ADB32394.1 ribosome small subunit-dependent GTPase A [Kribbella flavida DSM 17836]